MTPLELLEYSNERLRSVHTAFTQRQIELGCAGSYGSDDQINRATATLRDTAAIYAIRLTEHAKHVADYASWVVHSTRINSVGSLPQTDK